MVEISKTHKTHKKDIDNFRKGYLVLVSDISFLSTSQSPILPTLLFMGKFWTPLFFGKFQKLNPPTYTEGVSTMSPLYPYHNIVGKQGPSSTFKKSFPKGLDHESIMELFT